MFIIKFEAELKPDFAFNGRRAWRTLEVDRGEVEVGTTEALERGLIKTLNLNDGDGPVDMLVVIGIRETIVMPIANVIQWRVVAHEVEEEAVDAFDVETVGEA